MDSFLEPDLAFRQSFVNQSDRHRALTEGRRNVLDRA
jgi:hypothetical protein